MTRNTAAPVSPTAPSRQKKGEMHGFEQHISLTLPPLSTVYFQVPAARKPRAKKPPRQRTLQPSP